jgi:hypothetical protein
MCLTTETSTIDLYNIYNDHDNNKAVEKTDRVARRNMDQGTRHQHIWLGNFNRHHPLWDEVRNGHLFTEANLRMAQSLLDIVQDWGLHVTIAPITLLVTRFTFIISPSRSLHQFHIHHGQPSTALTQLCYSYYLTDALHSTR